MKTFVIAFAASLLASAVHAQTVTVAYDYNLGATAAQVQSWVALLYVNTTPFQLTPTCVTVPSPVLVTCTAPLPNITTGLTASGPQSFSVSLKDVILGEGPKSFPLVLVKPSAPTVPRIQ